MCDLDAAKISAVAIGYADLRLGKSVDNYSFSVEIAVGIDLAEKSLYFLRLRCVRVNFYTVTLAERTAVNGVNIDLFHSRKIHLTIPPDEHFERMRRTLINGHRPFAFSCG